MGKPQTMIAKALGIATTTLCTYYFSLLNYRPGCAGRRPHAPTPDTRRQVRALAADAMSQALIASALGITIPTLTKHYRDELDGGWRVTGSRNACTSEDASHV